MTVIGIIPARSGSKSVPNKNTRLLGNTPLLGWIVKAASKSCMIDKLIFSSDSDEYFKIAKSFNDQLIFHKRSSQLSVRLWQVRLPRTRWHRLWIRHRCCLLAGIHLHVRVLPTALLQTP